MGRGGPIVGVIIGGALYSHQMRVDVYNRQGERNWARIRTPESAHPRFQTAGGAQNVENYTDLFGHRSLYVVDMQILPNGKRDWTICGVGKGGGNQRN